AALLEGKAVSPALRRQGDRGHSHRRTVGCDVNQWSRIDELLLALSHAAGPVRLLGRAIGGKAAPDIIHQIKAGMDKDIDVVGLGQPKALRLPPAMIAR